MAVGDKYHIFLDSKGYIISTRSGKQYYQKKRAPTFVNKFGSGDSAYRDATFWQFFAQTNWRNGAKQLKFDDAGKFWKSLNVNINQLEELSLSKALVSAGQVAPGVKINCMAAWRSSQSWWNSNYGYRQQITITAPTGQQVPVGYPIKVTIDTAALQTASKVRADRNDWRIVYWNGSAWEDLVRDYVATTATFFGIKKAIAAGASDSNYYAYYGYAAETTSKQPSTEAEWNAVYGFFDTTPDANSVLVAHFREGSGTTINDDSTSTNNGTYINPDWGTDGKFGRYGKFNGNINNRRVDFGAGSNLDLGSMTLEAWIYLTADQPPNEGEFFMKRTSDGLQTAWSFAVQDNRKLKYHVEGNADLVGTTILSLNTWYHVAATHDGSTAKIFLNRTLDASGSMSTPQSSSGKSLKMGERAAEDGVSGFRGYIHHARVSNVARTSFPYVLSSEPTTSYGSETTTQPPASSFDLYAGASNGKIYKWDGGTGWTQAYDTANSSVNCVLITSVGGTQKMYWGTGDPEGITNGNAKLFTFDGSTWAAGKVFNTATESVVTALCEYNSKIYAGVGPQAKIYETSDVVTWTLSKRITVPQNPGYIYKLKEYNGRLYAFGGSPESLPTKYYNGFFYVFDQTTWQSVYPFDHTVGKSAEFYDAYLFLGTYHGQIYVYDTATLNPLFNFKDDYDWKVTILDEQYFDDKLYFALYPQAGSNETNIAVWCFDRHGMSAAHSISEPTGYRCFAVVNNVLMIGTGDDGYVYKLDPNTYTTQGWAQSSYFDANLPSIDKLYNTVDILHDPLNSGESIVVYYKFKESDSWTTLGTSNTVGATSKTLSFPSGTYSKKISLKYELNTTDTSKTPKLKEVILKYTLYPGRKWMWTMRLMAKKNLVLLDKSLESRTATTIRSDLEALLSSQQLYTFVDIDGTSYSVLFYDLDQTSWVVNQGDVNEDEVAITLLEA